MESFSLLEFNQLVKSILDKNLEKSYWIVAEIGELNVNQRGHCYLDLIEKQDNAIIAKTRGTIWSYTFSKLNNWFADRTGTHLKSGMKVMVNAAVQYHEVYGFSLNIKDIDPNFTIGERERKKQETIDRLEKEGIIDMNKSMVLPLVPQNLAIISSETAAGYGDFMHQLANNPYGYSIRTTLFNATMQGDQAVESILQCLHRIYEREEEFEAAVLIRGGGAQTDLDCFDDYELCSHLAQFPIPIITGIGHERDNTIADFVANTKMKTPTAVAEFVLSGFIEFESNVNDLFDQISLRSKEVLLRSNELLNQLDYQLGLTVQNKLHKADIELSRIEENIKMLPYQFIEKNQRKIDMIEKVVLGADPATILNRGFTITKVNGKPLTKVAKTNSGDIIETTSKNGKFESKVI